MYIKGHEFSTIEYNPEYALYHNFYSDEIKIEGSYTIEWDDDIPQAYIRREDVYISMDGKELSEKESTIVFNMYVDNWCNEIEMYGLDSEWMADRIAAAYDFRMED